MRKLIRLLPLLLFSCLLRAQIVEPTSAPPSGNTTNPTNIVYFAAAGSDTNDCMQHGVDSNNQPIITPCLSQAKFNTLVQPGNITVKFNRGDYFPWSQFACANHVAATATTTYTTNPIACPNVTIDAYGTGPAPMFEGANRIDSGAGTWSDYDGAGTWVLTYTPGALYAEKIYVDVAGIDSAGVGRLLNEPNGPAVTYAAGTTYYPGQLVTLSTRTYVVGNRGPMNYSPATALDWYRGFAGAEADATKTGIANVQANPGSTYNDTQAGKLYVHLVDGSNPANHVVQASVRLIGFLCESCNGWLVTHVGFEKYMQQGAFFTNYSTATSTNGYYTNVGNQFDTIEAWDNTSELMFRYAAQTGTLYFGSQASIIMNGNSSASTDGAAAGWKVVNGTFGRAGTIPGDEDGGSSWADVFVEGGNNPEIAFNSAVSWMHNAYSIRYNYNPWIHDNKAEGQNRGCAFCYASNSGFLMEWNSAAYGAGDIYQGGGNPAIASSGYAWDYTGHPENDVPGLYPQIIRHNVCHDTGISTRGALYNCWDTNTNQVVKGYLWDGNTCVNAYAACFSFEVISNSPAGAGISDITFRNNLGSQHKNYAAYSDNPLTGINLSNMLFFSNSTAPPLIGYFHSFNNVYQLGKDTVGFATHSAGTCAAFNALVGDTTSQCISAASDPIFTDIVNSVLTLKAGSPAINMPSIGQNVGALGIDYTPFYGSRYLGYLLSSGFLLRR